MTAETANPLAERAAAYLTDPALLESGLDRLREQYPDLSMEGLARRGEPISKERVEAALGCMQRCRPGQQKHRSYGLKQKFERWAGGYIANGELIAACLLVGVPVDDPRETRRDAFVHMTVPKDCASGNMRGRPCTNEIPIGSRKFLCDQCRSVPGRR